jgi:hypothetical protein
MFRVKFVVLLFLFTPLHAANFAKPPITLSAQDILPAEKLKGANFKVDDKVENDGVINSYTVNTDYGVLQTEGTAELLVRIAELNALITMEELDRGDVFKESVGKGIKATGEGIKELVTDPIDTTKDIVKGTGQFFSNIGQAFVSDNPHQDNALKVALGYDVAKRQFAYEFGINPYSAYEPVTDRLGEIARAAVAGGITPKLALASIDHTVATVARVSGTMRGLQVLVRDNPPKKLREINQEKLRAMGVSEALTNAFLDNYSFDPYEQTLLVGELETLNVAGRDVFLSRASLATEKSIALYYRSLAQMMGNFHRNVEPLKAVFDTAGILNVERRDGGRVILAPIDYVFWTEKVATRIGELEQALAAKGFSGEKEVWVTGKFDKVALEELNRSGWKVKQRVDPLFEKP